MTGLTLSASELSLVRQLSLLRVTSLLERHCERWVSVNIVNNLARYIKLLPVIGVSTVSR